MRIRSIMLAGVSLVVAAATVALAADGNVYFRGTDSFGARQAVDAAPKLAFAPATGLLLGGTASSEAATFTGPPEAFRLTASSGEIRVCPASGQCGSWGASGNVRDGDMVQARRAGPTAPGQTVQVEVTGLNLKATFDATAKSSAPSLGSFASKTVSPDVVAESALSTFTGWVQTRLTVSGGEARVCSSQGACGSWSASSDVHDGDQVQLRGVAGTFGTTKTVTASAGGASATFDVATRAKDTVPDAIAFGPAANGLEPGGTASSTIVTLAGFDDAPISITGGEYALNGASWTTAAGTAKAGDKVQIRTTGGTFGETKTATLDVGGVKASFSVGVRAKDTQPNVFALGTGPSNVEPGSTSTSNQITLGGFDDAPVTVSGTGATYSLNGAAYTTAAGTAKAGDTVRVQLTAGAFGESRVATLDVGGVTGTWGSTVRVKDTQPNAFAFVGATGAQPGSTVALTAVTLSGFDDAPVSVTGGEYILNGTTYTSSAGTAKAGDTIGVRGVAGAFGQTATVTVDVGGVKATGTISTRAKDTQPDAFALGTGPTGVEPGSISTSNLVTLAGFDDAPISVSGTGATYSLNGAAYTTASGTAKAGDTVRVQLTAGTFAETRSATLNVGGVTAAWNSTVRTKDTTPDAIANFTTLTSQTAGAVVTSDVRQLNGHEGVTVTVSGSGATVRSCTTSTCSGGTQSGWGTTAAVANGQFVQLQTTVGSAGSAAQTVSLSYGGPGAATWSVQPVTSVGEGNGRALKTDGTYLAVTYTKCGSGAPGSCTESVAQGSCQALGKKLVSHASDGGQYVVSLGATNSCSWQVSTYYVDMTMPQGSCVALISNSDWSQCCTQNQWHGVTAMFPSAGSSFGTGSGTNWGCQQETQVATNNPSCSTMYVACGN